MRVHESILPASVRRAIPWLAPALPKTPVAQLRGAELLARVFNTPPETRRVVLGGVNDNMAGRGITFSGAKEIGLGTRHLEQRERTLLFSPKEADLFAQRIGYVKKEGPPILAERMFAALTDASSRCAQRRAGRGLLRCPDEEVKTIVFGGELFNAQCYQVNGTTIEELGLNPAILNGGGRVYVLSDGDYEKYKHIPGGIGEWTNGIYSPYGGVDFGLAVKGEKEKMPQAKRFAVVPQSVAAHTLVHEISHEIHANSLEGEEKLSFARTAIRDIVRTGAAAPASPQALFYMSVAARCTPPYDVCGRIAFHPKTQEVLAAEGMLPLAWDTALYLGEVFAYGVTKAAGFTQDEEVKAVPKALRQYFEKHVLTPRQVSRSAPEFRSMPELLPESQTR